MSTVALIPAAGRGERLGAGLPKAFVDLAGHSMLHHAVRGVQASGVVDAVVLSVPIDLVDQVRSQFSEVIVVAGGAERSDSVRAALSAAPPSDVVLVHDAARALTPQTLFVDVVAAVMAGAPAVVPGLPVVDTIKSVDPAGTVTGTVDRGPLRAVQTPQGFDSAMLSAAYAALAHSADGAQFTDDAGLVEAQGIPVRIIPGDPMAFKITTPWDLQLATWLLHERTRA
ncbi:2-C-methyl-D-erythritol 4-phosphate cytidylyltransferase [Williamsia limnetica]|uniref:2-C-methyl-D-erythritol 4-phosphate cytidylyltransferase n=1 Tax=Williamsia limnetica TaxID=882452 RepID=A0A318RUK4_WILLI|nr:2-C-methyl-D-erythritol 4-phosphate cytidylyltransferase [Williamsia limnetica]PYE20040.1 2-C-methyl-D-erythritol 4-phosphate cytidylyltransferase [Williamsia limnetica]